MKVLSQMMLVAAALFIGSTAVTAKPTGAPSPKPTRKPTRRPTGPTAHPTSGLWNAFTFHLPGNDQSVVQKPPAFTGVGVCNFNEGSAYVCKKFSSTGECTKKTPLPNSSIYVKNGKSDPDVVRIHQRVIQPADFAWWNTNVCVGGVGIHFTADCTGATKDMPNPMMYHYVGPVDCTDGV